MTYETILTALSDPTRRRVLDRLRDGPLPVGRIAEDLPVSRPAVSQHLKVLLDAGLVSRRSQATRNLYAIVPGGAGPLGDWLGDLRANAADRAPVAEGSPARSLSTRLQPDEAWQLFCDDLATWWPVARVSLSALTEGALPQVVILDALPGGALREVLFDGSEGTWARVVAADAPNHLAFDWTLGRDDEARVTLDIVAEGGGSRLTVAFPDRAAEEMWDAVLDRFAAAANSSLSNF